MVSESNGWVVINTNHPSTGTKYIVESTFSSTKKEAIKNFIEGTNNSWLYWKKKYNYSVVRASQHIVIS